MPRKKPPPVNLDKYLLGRGKTYISYAKLHKFFPAYYSKTEMEQVIFGLLEQWKQAQESEEK